MANCFLFFRLWPGFSEPFPFDRFDGFAKDEELFQALNSYAREEIGRPEVRRQIKQTAKKRRRELLAALRKRRGVYANRPAGFPNRPTRQLSERDLSERRDPLVCRLGAYLGWWRGVGDDPLPFGARVWFYQVPSSELAETVVSALNGRTDLHFDDNRLEYYLQPRFGFVEDTDVALRISALRCIESIQQGKIPEVRSGEMALAMGRKAMAIAEEVLEAAAPPTPVQHVLAPSTPGQPTGNTGSTSTGTRRGRKVDKATIRRADFAKPRRENGESWVSILAAYEKEYPRDVDVNESVIRLAFERQYPELSRELKKKPPTE